jgi:gamma-glutamylcyclotransferase (GGCT)/AIG2-like uncharacterized protein YtfP
MIEVFVYGTLVKGGHYHQYYLQGKAFLGKGFVAGYKQYNLGGLYGIFPEPGERVQGEVYEMEPAALAKLDHLHNLGAHFTRSMVEVELENGVTLPAETYIWNG